MFLLLGAHFEELYSIFTFYAKSGATGTSASSGFMLQQGEVTNLALHCGLATEEFMMARIHLIMKMSDQVRNLPQSPAISPMPCAPLPPPTHPPSPSLTLMWLYGLWAQGDRAGDESGTGKSDRFAATGAGDKALEMFEFLEMLVRIALQRQNPKLGTVGHEHTVDEPLPACLDYLLTEHILKFAHRDALKDVLEAMKVDDACLGHFASNKKALKKEFEKICLANRDGSRMFATVVMPVGAFIADLVGRRVVKDLMVTPTPSVVGDDTRPRHSNLSQLDAKGTFTTGQNKNEASGNDGVDYDEWCHCLGLCGHIKYEELDEMCLADRVAGVIANYLGEKDEQKVISECLSSLPLPSSPYLPW